MSKKLTLDFLSLRTKNSRLDQITKLNLWGNDLDDISILEECPNIEILSLVQNKITSLKAFSKMLKLSELYLRCNSISEFSEIDNLKNCKQLKVLSLNENPISQKPNYRKHIIATLPNLTKLDDVGITNTERNKFNKKELLEVTTNSSNPFNNNINNAIPSQNNESCSERNYSKNENKLSLTGVGVDKSNSDNNVPKVKSKVGGVANFKKLSTTTNIRNQHNNKIEPIGERSFGEIENCESGRNFNNNKSYVKPTLNKSVTLEGNKNEDGNSANKAQYKKKIIGNYNLSLTKFNEESDIKMNKNAESVVVKDFECNERDKSKRKIVLNSLKMLIQTLNEQELKEVKKEVENLLMKE